MRKRSLWKGGRFLVSAVLIYLLFRRVDIHELAAVLKTSQWWLLILSTVVLCARHLIAAGRWSIMLVASGVRVPLARLLYWYMTATFFNMFLPTALGGDVVRIYQLGRHARRNADAAASVLMERVLGFLALIAMAVVALVFSETGRQQPIICVAVAVAALGYALVLVALFHRGFGRMLTSSLRRIGLPRIGEAAQRGYAALHSLQDHRWTLVMALVISIFFQGIGVICTYLVGLSLGLEVSLEYYFLSVPIIWLVTMLPISINGIGVREGGFVLFFTAAGVSTADALLLSLLTFAQLLLIGLLGGVLFVSGPLLFPSVAGSRHTSR